MDDELNDGCVCHVSLLNGEMLEIVLNKKHTVGDLLTYANKQCELPSPAWAYFGLAYIDEKQQIIWLSSADCITQLPFPKCVAAFSQVNLHHFVRYFPHSFASVTNAVTLLYLFYDARIQFLKGYLMQELFDFIQCCAALIILCNGQLDLDTDEIAEIFNEQIRPSINLLRNFDISLDQIYVQVRDEIRRLRSTSQGNLILLFLKHAERSQTYGSAFYNVADSQQRPLTIAINSRCMAVFDSSNLYQTKKVFNFGSVDNIMWKDTTFTVHARSQQSPAKMTHLNGIQTLPNRAFQKSSFTCQSVQQCKMIWAAAVAQHKYYMEQQVLQKPNEFARKLSEQLEELLGSTDKLASLASTSSIDSYSTISRSSMPPSSLRLGTLSSTSLSTNKNLTPEEKQELTEEYRRLKTKLKSIEDELIAQLNELKGICLEEAQISGQMPKEIYMTLLPGEKLPPVTKRIGTSFKLDQQLIENSNGTDRIVQLQADIQLHRKIVQAAERLANDKTTNKSVRRKRRKDLQAAALKLRGLEKGLYQLRISASKPDISANDFGSNGLLSRSRAGSGFSLNSLKNWPNFMGGSRIPKSCPTTPRGSIPDLSAPMDTTDKLTVNNLSKSKHADQLGNQQRRPIEIQSSWTRVPTTSISGSSLPPAIPSRRPTVTSLSGQRDGVKKLGHSSSSASEFPTYTNIGYKSSVPYKSAYRQQNYPTLEQYPMQRSKSVTGSPSSTKSQHDSSTSFSIEKDSPGAAQRLHALPTNSCSGLPPNGSSSIATGSVSINAIDGEQKVDSNNLSAIVSHMNQAAADLRLQQNSINYRNPRVVMRNTQPVRDFSAASLDRRALKDVNGYQTEIHHHSGNQQRDSVSSGVSSASSSSNASPTSVSRTTTFPVEYSYSTRNQPPKRGSEPPTRLGLSVSSSRVQPANFGQKLSQFDPRMENLLASIHSRAAVQLGAGIPLQPKKSPNGQEKSPSKTATVV